MVMVTITRHFLINIFQMQRFSAMKFYMGYKKNMTFLWYQNHQKFGEKLKR